MLDRLRHEDDGFTLVETLAAMIVLAILAVSVAGVLFNTFDLTRSNAARVVAANLAVQQIEATRALRALDVPDGASPVVERTVNGVDYRVMQNANLVEVGTGVGSLCAGSGSSSDAKLPYKLVTVTVEWDGMGRAQPVRQDTLLSLGIGFSGLDPTRGTGAVAVLGASGQPQSGVTVTLQPGLAQRTTGIDGCAVFPGLTPGTSYTATVGQAGWVGRNGTRSAASSSFSVQARGLSRVSLEYERAGALAVSLVGPEGLQPPATLGATLSSSLFSTANRSYRDCSVAVDPPYQCVSGQPRTAAALFPGQYGARSGTCTDGLSAASVLASVTAATTTPVSVPLAGVRVNVVTPPSTQFPTGQPAAGHTVYALHAADGVCLSQAWPMTPASTASQSLALPAGTWTFSLTLDGSPLTPGGQPWPTRTLTVGEPVPTIEVSTG